MCAYQFENNEANNRLVDNQINLAFHSDAYSVRILQPNSFMPVQNFMPMQNFMQVNNGYRAMEYVPPQVMRYLQTGTADFSAFYVNPIQQQNYFRQMQMREMMMMQARYYQNNCLCPYSDSRMMPGLPQREFDLFERPQRFRHDFPQRNFPQRDFPEPRFEHPDRRRNDSERDSDRERDRDRQRDRDREKRDLPRRRPPSDFPPANNDSPQRSGELRPEDVRRREGSSPIPQNERRALMILALKTAGLEPSEANIKGLNTIIEKESSWRPNIVNNWDSNARKGTPSKGLMQTIGPTFNAHKMSGYDDILNPLHNMIAGIRYATKRYGNLLNVPGLRSMAAGGPYRGY